MTKKVSKSKNLVKKLLNPYRMVIINEETFEEQVQLRVSRLGILLISVVIFVLFCTIVFMTIAYTPLKEHIPGYDSSELRKKSIQNLFVTDSLIDLYNKNLQYLNAVKSVLSEEIDFQDSELSEQELNGNNQLNISSITPIPEDSLLRAFVSQQEKYNFQTAADIDKNVLLIPPAFGPISQGFDPEEKHFAVDIVLKKNSPVKSIADGIVIFSEWSAQTGYVIIVEHNQGALSVYKHNASLNKKQGDAVLGGEVIASAGNTGELSTGFHLHFELWVEGYPMNPENFFNFSQP